MPDKAPNSPAPAAPVPSADGIPATPKPPKPKPTLKELFRESISGYKKIWPFIDKYRWRFIASIIAGGGSAIFTVGQAEVLRIVAHMNFDKNPDGAGGVLAIRGIVVDMALHGAPKAGPTLGHVFLVCSLFPIVIVARCICDYLEGYYMTWVSLHVLHDLRVKIFQHILSQSFAFFNKAKIGSLISRVSNDTRSAQLSITAVTDDIVTQPLTIIFLVANMLRMDWRFTMYCMCLFPLCLIPIQVFGKRVRKIGLLDETANAELMVLLHEGLAGIRLVKSLCREPYEIKRFSASSSSMVAVGLKVRTAMLIVPPLIESMGAIGIFAAFVYAFFSHMPVSIFVTMIGSVVLLYIPVKKLSKVHVSVQKAIGATTKIFELLEVNPAVTDVPEAVTLKNCKGDIRYEEVIFEYNARLQPALRRVSLHIEAGKSYALVGSSGAGKSTMFSLLLRFYDPRRGCIRVDGHDIRTLTQKSLRQNISIVSQDTFLFNTTIMENIRYGRLDATDEEIYDAARQAYAHDFIEAQPKGYETVIGDKGCNISGGQQQRLSIARALLKNAPILLLDEAMSALDSESESEIQAAIERLSKGRTVIAIAHRLSTILKSDQIVVMEKGQIQDIGPHEELLEKSTLYRHFYDLQFNKHKSAVEDIPMAAVGGLA
ncbi:MAG TPA: ABC transporter transmembrane domain-containing protein [Chthoniobacteraceae bacterium]|jgi:subfamily B ATP-binding cassette protein MsbA|nr:ABC transporter transmembrane domain-containing protein [Chthoniobacteraceae bacterium]